MRKFLLSFAAVCTLGVSAQETKTVAFYAGTAPQADQTVLLSGTVAGQTFMSDYVNIEFVKVNNSSSNVTSNQVRWYANDQIVITGVDNAKITKASMVAASTSYANKIIKDNAGNELGTWSGTTWTYDIPNSVSELTIVASAQIRFTSLTITCEIDGGSGTTVKSPTFELVETADGYAVSMASETEGADIYYVSSDSEMPTEDPTDASTKYTAPVDVWMKTYFKAVAYVDGVASNVATYTAEPPYILENFMPLADFGGDAQIDLRANVTAVYQNGQNLYVVDANNDGMLLYGDAGKTLKNGDVIDGLKGTYTVYKNLPEITNYTLGEVSEGSTVSPKEIALAQLAATPLNSYIKLTNVNINGTEVSDGETTGTLFNKFSVDVPDGDGFTLEGFLGKYNEDLQIYPISVTGGVVIETVATPAIEPQGGELEVGTEITITCETEGATIYYTTDGTDPTTSSTEYTAPIEFSEAMTLKAFAVKEGMNDSEIATAVFTVFDPSSVGSTITFNFTENGYTNAEEITTVTEGPVTLTFAKGSNNNNSPKYYNTGTAIRLYSGNTLTVAVDPQDTAYEKYVLGSVVFTTDSSNGTFNAETTFKGSSDNVFGTYDKADKTWTAGDAEDGKTLIITNGGSSGHIRIQKMEVILRLNTAVEGIAAEENATPVYFNLQGVRVANPENGLFIEVKGNKSRKVLFNK